MFKKPNCQINKKSISIVNTFFALFTIVLDKIARACYDEFVKGKGEIMEIGKRIEKVLENSNISQRELASRIGVDESIISRIINGERVPKSDVLANIATALHTTSDYLLGIENDNFDIGKEARLLARNSSMMSDADKKILINALFEEE